MTETAAPEGQVAARPAPPRKKRPIPDPDQFLKLAKKMAVRNFNESRDPDRSKPIDETQVQVSGFSKVMSHWKTMVISPVVRNIIWEVTYNASKNQVYVEAYRKMSNTMIQLGDDGE